jgi:hypothetical protein
MAPNDLNKLLARQPFRKLVLHLTNGTKYDIRHPDIASVGLSVVWLLVPVDPMTAALGYREVVVSLRHIVEVEVTGTPAMNNGQEA